MTEEAQSPFAAVRTHRGRNAAIVAVIVALWLVIDQATKAFFNQFPAGTVVFGPFGDFLCLRTVHNTGAAWGMFDGATVLLGLVSVAVVIVLLALLFVYAPNASALSAVAVGLVVAGGIGNAIDRFALGYVVDFIQPLFIDFPVFNVADIGVTCGFVLLVLSLLLSDKTKANGPEGNGSASSVQRD